MLHTVDFNNNIVLTISLMFILYYRHFGRLSAHITNVYWTNFYCYRLDICKSQSWFNCVVISLKLILNIPIHTSFVLGHD